MADYLRGDLDAASSEASEVHSAALLPEAKLVLSEIKEYQDAMARAALLARRDEAKGDFKTALHGFESVLALDGRQAEALEGSQRVIAKLRSDSHEPVDGLEQGIRSYYSSQFELAADSISNYLNSKNEVLHYKGAAHFYLGASVLSEAILADPHDPGACQQSSAERRTRVCGGATGRVQAGREPCIPTSPGGMDKERSPR